MGRRLWVRLKTTSRNSWLVGTGWISFHVVFIVTSGEPKNSTSWWIFLIQVPVVEAISIKGSFSRRTGSNRKTYYCTLACLVKLVTVPYRTICRPSVSKMGFITRNQTTNREVRTHKTILCNKCKLLNVNVWSSFNLKEVFDIFKMNSQSRKSREIFAMKMNRVNMVSIASRQVSKKKQQENCGKA